MTTVVLARLVVLVTAIGAIVRMAVVVTMKRLIIAMTRTY